MGMPSARAGLSAAITRRASTLAASTMPWNRHRLGVIATHGGDAGIGVAHAVVVAGGPVEMGFQELLKAWEQALIRGHYLWRRYAAAQ
jgi:hypothetical protein